WDGRRRCPQRQIGHDPGAATPEASRDLSRICRQARARHRRAAGAVVIPVAVLTGFLGSGKTTLLAHLLRRPEFSRTAVLINEFGEIGLDHELVEASDGSFVELQTGCLCCKIRN